MEPTGLWAKALESSAKSELSKLLSRDTDVDVIIRNFLSEGSISRKASLCEHFKDGESLFRCHEKARKAVAVQAQKVFEALSPADQQSLDVKVGTSIAKVLSKAGGNKAYLAKIFSYVDKRKISNNMRVLPFSLLPKGDAENVFSFGEARPKTLVDMLLMALLLYTIPFLMRSEGDKLKLQTVAPSGEGRDFLDWMLEKLNLALKKRTGYNLDRAQPKKTRALPRKNYKSYDMGDVAARAAEIVLDESREESCDVQRILCSPGPVDGSPGENGRQQLETSVFSKLADLVNDKAYVINPQFSADQVGVDPSKAPETDKLRLDESSARALLKKMKGDFQTAMKLAESSGFNDADPISAAASHESDGEDSDNSDDDAGGNDDDDVGYNKTIILWEPQVQRESLHIRLKHTNDNAIDGTHTILHCSQSFVIIITGEHHHGTRVQSVLSLISNSTSTGSLYGGISSL
ncbi:Hypothetical Protein FCC1311_017422 [Hondaea fermentalgiana]|uniref:Uncharacterized protein n=1 Tax=Hondaea fermentalgiana TaxID=2315210 RepID=A0A2R5GAE3_9STRA|nr:Hypothetical Protein FCC1311_017422 [Hondaea fermentalgiana]|eukprot:GBG25523.1 Hypothetical Protein FCC1311_017422 [Hondaea fermentalgiana]